jgi:hypothetical protein
MIAAVMTLRNVREVRIDIDVDVLFTESLQNSYKSKAARLFAHRPLACKSNLVTPGFGGDGVCDIRSIVAVCQDIDKHLK